ncbi:MAG: T9SS type A sorting domain-containing protein [Candidatus Coatesbacteria bacterium]|nr:T9SS type A sorting domain-containing protein [Candidatus Coatesbacteria bacterium]
MVKFYICIVIFLSSDVLFCSIWPVWRGNTQRNGFMPLPAIDNPVLKWDRDLGYRKSSIDINKRIYTYDDENLLNYDYNGNCNWKEKRDTSAVIEFIMADSLYALSYLSYSGTSYISKLLVYNPDHEILWKDGFSGEASYELMYFNTILRNRNIWVVGIVNSQDLYEEGIICAYKDSGEKIWSICFFGCFKTGGNSNLECMSIDKNNTVYIALCIDRYSEKRLIYAVDNGRIVWQKDYGENVVLFDAPVLDDSNEETYVYLTYNELENNKTLLQCINGFNANILWNFEREFCNEPLPPAIGKSGNIYIPDVTFLSKTNKLGEKISEKVLADTIISPPVIDEDENIYIVTKEKVISFDLNFKERWELSIDGFRRGVNIKLGEGKTIFVGNLCCIRDKTGIEVSYPKSYSLPIKISLSCSPNPFRDKLKIDLQSSSDEDLKIYDITGRLLLNKSFSKGKHSFVWKASTSGVFIIKFGKEVKKAVRLE